MLIFLLLVSNPSDAQYRQLNYKIVQGGDEIGWMKLEKSLEGNRMNLVLISEIRTRIIFLITVNARETSTFENGRLIHSSQFRKTNGSTKVDKRTSLVSDRYVIMKNGERQNTNISYISTNLLSLYFNEPVGVRQVYCDNHECFVQLVKTNDGGYKLNFPDGNSNTFYYSGGICSKIKINHTFYSAEIILKS